MTVATPRILLIGTADTKSPELTFLRDCIFEAGGDVVFMDIGVLARGTLKADIPNDAVAAAAHSTGLPGTGKTAVAERINGALETQPDNICIEFCGKLGKVASW